MNYEIDPNADKGCVYITVYTMDWATAIEFTGNFNITQGFTLELHEMTALRILELHLDEPDYTYKTRDGSIEYKDGVLKLDMKSYTRDGRRGINKVTITNVREFFDKLDEAFRARRNNQDLRVV